MIQFRNMRSASWTFIAHFLIYFTLINVSDEIPLSGRNLRVADPSEYPFLVSIERISDGNEPFCLGTLISQKSVLTASHCLLDEQLDDVHVLVGMSDSRQGTYYKLKSWISYDQWAKFTDQLELSDYDVAVMTLKQQVEGVNAAPIQTTFRIEDLYGQRVRMVGWSPRLNITHPMKLKTAVVTVQPNDICERKIELASNQPFQLPEAQFCILAEPWVLGNCGDSGGPLFNNQNQVLAIYVGVCPSTLIKSHYPREYVHRRLVNLFAHLRYYRCFINDVKED